MVFRRSLATVLFIASLAACGGSDDDAGSSSALFRATCGFYDACCKAAGKANDATACEELYTYFSGSVNAAKVDECVAALKTAPCGELPKSCQQASAGSGVPGAACKSNSDCAFPDEAVDAGCMIGGTTAGCFVRLAPEAGKPCGLTTTLNVDHECKSSLGYTCVSPGAGATMGVCTKLPGPGEACTGSFACAGGAPCDKGVCGNLSKAGDPCTAGCTGDFYCEAGSCADKLEDGAACTGSECKGFCDSGTKKCVGSSSGGYLCVTRD